MRAAGELSGLADSRRELRGLLLRVEEAHRADILTYSSGHLNPDRLSQKAPDGAAIEQKWISSFAPEKNALQRRGRMQPEVERMRKASPVALSSPRPEKRWKQPCRLLDRTETLSLNTSSSAETGQASGGPEDQHGLAESLIAGVSRNDQLRTRREFDRSVLKIQDLRAPKGLGWNKAAKKQERWLEQVWNDS